MSTLSLSCLLKSITGDRCFMSPISTRYCSRSGNIDIFGGIFCELGCVCYCKRVLRLTKKQAVRTMLHYQNIFFIKRLQASQMSNYIVSFVMPTALRGDNYLKMTSYYLVCFGSEIGKLYFSGAYF